MNDIVQTVSRVFSLVFLFGFVFSLVAQGFESPSLGLKDEFLEELESQGFVFHLSPWKEDSRSLRFTPQNPLAREVQEAVRSLSPRINSEFLMIIPDHNSHKLSILNYFRDFTRLQNIDYVNLRTGETHLLVRNSHRIKSAEDLSYVAFEPVSSFADEDIWGLQELPPFDDLILHNNIKIHNEDDFHLRIVNLNRMIYRGFPIVAKKRAQIHISVFSQDNYIIIYGIYAVRMSSLVVFARSHADNSFASRMVVLWDRIREDLSNLLEVTNKEQND